jgi:hypothetical protein
MSHEDPGDGKRCDHCNAAGSLSPNRGERLCFRCLDHAVTAELNEPVGPAQVPAHLYITPRAWMYR